MIRHAAHAAARAAVLAGLLFATGCSSPAPGDRAASDDTMMRIVCLNPYPAEILCNLGAADLIVAVGSVPRDGAFDACLGEKPVVGSSYGGAINLEMIIALDPDIVFCSSSQAELVSARGIEVYETGTYDIEGIMGLIADVGRIAGRREAAAALVDSMHARIRYIEERVADATDRPLVYFEQNTPGKTRAKGSLTHELITRAGGVNIAANEPVAFPLLSQEFIIEQDPDIVIVEEWGTAPEEMLAREGWQAISAIRNERILLSRNYYTGYTPRALDGLEAYARFFHPERFPE